MARLPSDGFSRAIAAASARRLSKVIPQSSTTRTLALISVLDAIGSGAYTSTCVLYFVGVLHLSPSAVAGWLSLAGLFSLAATVPAGLLADRRDPRHVYVAATSCQSISALLLVTATSVPLYAMFTSLFALAVVVGGPARSVFIASLVAPEDLVRTRAYNRAVHNVGLALGAGVGALIVTVGSRSAYVSAFVLNALSFAACAVLAAKLPLGTAVPAAASGRTTALRDGRFLLTVAVNAVLMLNASMLQTAVPIYVTQQTAAPAVVIPCSFMLNTLLVVLTQVRLSRGCDDAPGIARAQRLAAGALAMCCPLFLCAHYLSAGPAAVLVLTAVAMVTLGEMWSSAGGWGTPILLAPQSARGQYFATYGLGMSLAECAGPAALTWLMLSGAVGWMVIAAAYLAAGLVAAPVLRAAVRSRSVRSRSGEVLADSPS